MVYVNKWVCIKKSQTKSNFFDKCFTVQRIGKPISNTYMHKGVIALRRSLVCLYACS